MAIKIDPRIQMTNRFAFEIENGNTARIIKISFNQAYQIAQDALDATGYKSLAAARRYYLDRTSSRRGR